MVSRTSQQLTFALDLAARCPIQLQCLQPTGGLPPPESQDLLFLNVPVGMRTHRSAPGPSPDPPRYRRAIRIPIIHLAIHCFSLPFLDPWQLASEIAMTPSYLPCVARLENTSLSPQPTATKLRASAALSSVHRPELQAREQGARTYTPGTRQNLAWWTYRTRSHTREQASTSCSPKSALRRAK